MPGTPRRLQHPQTSILIHELKSQVCFSTDRFTSYFLSPEQFRSVSDWVGKVRARNFRLLSPHAPEGVDLDGRDDNYWHLLVLDHHKQALAGCLRLRPAGWHSARLDGSSSYLEHCYPGLDQHLRTGGLAYVEIGRTFVARPYQRTSLALMVLLQAMASIPLAMDHPHLLGMVSYNHFAHNEELNQLFLSALMQPPYRDKLVVPLPRHPLEGQTVSDPLPPTVRLAHMEKQLRERFDVRFRVPVLLRRYMQFGNARVVNFSLARDFNQITEILMHCDLTLLKPRQRQSFVVPHLRRVWEGDSSG